MKRLVYISVFILLSQLGFAQQDALYSQYMHNPFMYNPAYAGSRNTLSGTISSRKQWKFIPGNPKTYSLNFHSPIKNEKMAIGINILSDALGPQKNLAMLATYAYHLKFRAGILSLGLRAGVYSYRLDRSQLNFRDQRDTHISANMSSKTLPTFDFGAYYYTKSFYAGVAVAHIAPVNINYTNNYEMRLNRHYYVHMGKAFRITDYFLVKPSTLVRIVPGAPVNYDLTLMMLFQKVFWFGTSYRSSGDLILIFEVNIGDFMRVGHANDFLSLAKVGSGGTNEIFIGVDIRQRKKKVVSPRYL
ncbi:MAG: type IX secretion system membrane protein PorP/SprF [Flavobacteriales bacterium]|nr:type IX secretion system membrane protein PorP/SprF [Flavobacteriales bacterium]